MPDETKPAQSNQSKSTQGGRNRSNYKGRNNRSHNRPDNRSQSKPQTQVNPFEAQALQHTEKANYWRKRVNGYSAFTLLYSAVTLSIGTVASGAQQITALALIGFTLIFLVLHAARQYSEHKSNAALNKYRHNIIVTAENMAQLTKDPVTKEEIMLEALTAIGSVEKD